ncbi:copper chaperone PCu(A)C [Alkalisalibacterium limincola]|uniref:copper chaperone PCu(A)C n=1 Tax=Alkalisalibacterium limincola TaxID=2699169 RepID=UPI0021079946|nr:copper chaperone PCu(A)C [Alkalisalibacterium limincola]
MEIHEMVSAGDGTMQMREVEGGLPLPGGISVDLRPGGLHLMFFGPDTARWQAGEGIPVTLVFEGVGEREARMDVYAPGEAPADGALRMRGPDAAGDDEEHHDHHGH